MKKEREKGGWLACVMCARGQNERLRRENRGRELFLSLLKMHFSVGVSM